MWYVLALLAAILGALVFWIMWREDFDGMRSEWRYYRDRKSRKPLSLDDFYERYYTSSNIEKGTIEQLAEVCAELYRVKTELIRPDDNYPRIFGCDEELIDAIESRFGIAMKDDDLSQIDGTFDSIARYLQSRLDQPSEPY